MTQPLWETIWQFPTKLNIQLPYDPASVLLSIDFREVKIHVHIKTCYINVHNSVTHNSQNLEVTQMFLTDKWLNKL